MARPLKKTIDYFPHDCIRPRNLSLLKRKFGNDFGYRVYYELKELLGLSDDLTLEYTDDYSKLYVEDKLDVERNKLDEVLLFMAEIGILHKDSYEAGFLFWPELVLSVEDVYKKRKTSKPHPPCEAMANEAVEHISNDNHQGRAHWAQGLADSLSDYNG